MRRVDLGPENLDLPFALAAGTPGFNRPTIAIVFPHRLVSSLSGKGKYKSMWLAGAKIDAKSKDAGITPTTVTGPLSSVNARPTTPGSDANRLTHNPWLSMATLGPFHLHSSCVNSLPI